MLTLTSIARNTSLTFSFIVEDLFTDRADMQNSFIRESKGAST